MDLYISQTLVDFSSVIKSDDYVTGHVIEPHTKPASSSFKELFNVLAPSVGFFLSFLAANLFYFLSVFLLALAARKAFDLGGRLSFAPKFIAKFKAYKVLLISYALMDLLVMQLISSNLSTEKVIVDVTDLLFSPEAIKSTRRKACFLGWSFKRGDLVSVLSCLTIRLSDQREQPRNGLFHRGTEQHDGSLYLASTDRPQQPVLRS